MSAVATATELPTTDGPLDPFLNRPQLLTDVAGFLGISVKTLDRARAAGKLRTVKFGTRRFIPADELRRLAAEGVATR